MNVELKDLSLATFQKYISRPVLVRGLLSARFSVTWPGHGDLPVRVSGSLEGRDIEVLSPTQPLARAVKVEISHGEIVWPDKVTMDRLVMNQPEIWIRRTEHGHIVGVESEGIDRPEPTPVSGMEDKQTGAADAPVEWSIGKIIVGNGAIHFEDRSITPSYSDSLQNLDMTVDDFVTQPRHAAAIAGRSDLASGGSFDFNGRAALFGPIPDASLKATLHRFAVPSTNSYLKRTVSHYTTDGTLTTEMHIRLSGDRLEVLSDVTLSDLEVEPVPNATHRTVQERIGLPLRLLIALLKDDSGRIVITFPISGPLSNPTFDWTNAIWATIRNAVVKLITLPIRSIGWLVTGSHQVDELPLDPITFDPGSTTIRPEMDRTLRDLARLLRSADHTVLYLTPILSPADLEALRRLPPQSWPIPGLDTPETAGHVLAVRRAYLVAARLAGLAKVPSERLPVAPPKPDTSERGQPSVKLRLEKVGDASAMGGGSSTGRGES